MIAVEAHRAVAIVSVHGALRLVDGQAVIVHAEPVAVRVGIGNQARLEHFVWRKAHAGDDVARFESGLLDFGEIIFGIAVEHEFADFDERVIFVRPDFCQIKRIEVIGLGLFFGHDLDGDAPLGEIAFFDGDE